MSRIVVVAVRFSKLAAVLCLVLLLAMGQAKRWVEGFLMDTRSFPDDKVADRPHYLRFLIYVCLDLLTNSPFELNVFLDLLNQALLTCCESKVETLLGRRVMVRLFLERGVLIYQVRYVAHLLLLFLMIMMVMMMMLLV